VIDITMTACRREEILRRTLESFKKFLFGKTECRLILNVDPVGDNVDSFHIVEVAKEYFPHIIANCPSKASFPTAFKWCWEQVSAEFAFHLEDDWELAMPVSLLDMIFLMDKVPNLAVLRLPKWRTEEDKMKNWNKFFAWNGMYFECPSAERASVGFCGHPSLIRGTFVKETVPYLDVTTNPEKQFHYNRRIVQRILCYQYGVFADQNQPAAILEIGEKWKIQNGWGKKGSKAFFTEWQKTA